MVEKRKIEDIIKQGETLTVEFKRDNPLSDRELVEAVVALANTEGGILLLGVEDDGAVSGLHKTHTDIFGIPPLVANKTIPSISVRAERREVDGHVCALIQVPKSHQPVSTSEGLLQRRRIKLDGSPEAVPFYPHEFIQRQSSMGLIDPSAILLENISQEQLDPLQRQRIRNAIRKYNGDKSLQELADNELDGALGLCREANGALRPTVAGLLLLGTENLIRQHLPAYEVAFQVLQGTDVKVNEFFHKPLIETFEEVELLFRARLEEEEIQIGLFRVPIPNYDRRAFREALVNALVHRDLGRLGTVHVRLNGDGLHISNPGGFIEGVRLDNLLVADPRSRNPLLADIIKRIGLAERTGRGIDRIFEGMLRYGRPAPDYSLSDDVTVSVDMQNSAADFDFLEMILQQEEKQGPLPIDTLIILSKLRRERRLSSAELAKSVQKPETSVHASLEKLVETGFLEPYGTGRGRSYTLSAFVYSKSGKRAEYIRQAGFTAIRQEQMVLSYIEKHGSIRRAEVMELCHLSGRQANYLLKKLADSGKALRNGEKKRAFYTLRQ
jgi:ATP-dependent DNA helicase RecG